MEATNKITGKLSIDIATQWVSEVTGLVSPPDVCMRIFELVQSPDTSASDIGKVISHDPNLTARLLKLINSSLFHFPNKIDTVSRAITIIGTRELYSLVIAVSAIKSFSNIPTRLVNMDTFWRHSIFCGILARNLAQRCNILHPERMFIAGLLHDIGSLILYYQAPEVSRDLIMMAQGDEDILCQSETDEFGFNHADLGSKLLGLWMMPESLQNAVFYHHSPEKTDNNDLEARIVHLADKLAHRSEIGALFEKPGHQKDIEASAWKALGISLQPGEQDQFIGDAGIQFTDTVSTLLPRR